MSRARLVHDNGWVGGRGAAATGSKDATRRPRGRTASVPVRYIPPRGPGRPRGGVNNPGAGGVGIGASRAKTVRGVASRRRLPAQKTQPGDVGVEPHPCLCGLFRLGGRKEPTMKAERPALPIKTIKF